MTAMVEICINPKTIMADLEDAADTMRRLPHVRGPRLAQCWLDYIYSKDDLAEQQPKHRMLPPTPEALTKMDTCLDWLRWLEPDVAKMLWMRAERTPWQIICQVYGAPKSTVLRHWRGALHTIQEKLLQNASYKTLPAKSFSRIGTVCPF
jgi:hypothetical protein